MLQHFLALFLLVSVIIYFSALSRRHQSLNPVDLLYQVLLYGNFALEDIILFVQQLLIAWSRLYELSQSFRDSLISLSIFLKIIATPFYYFDAVVL